MISELVAGFATMVVCPIRFPVFDPFNADGSAEGFDIAGVETGGAVIGVSRRI